MQLFEEEKLINISAKPADHLRRNTLFVLSSPVVNYEKKFQFPGLPNSELNITPQENILIIPTKYLNKADTSANQMVNELSTKNQENISKVLSKNLNVTGQSLQKFPIYSSLNTLKQHEEDKSRNPKQKKSHPMKNELILLNRDPIKDFFILVLFI